MRRLLQFLDSETAVSAIEYAMLGALILVVTIFAITAVGTTVSQMYDYVRDQVVNALP
jgi:pilus assembly protein Flp/PilA